MQMTGWSMGRATEMYNARERENGTLREKGMGRKRKRKRERASRERRVTKVRRIKHDTGWTNEQTSAYASIRQHTCGGLGTTLDAQMSIRQNTPAYASIYQHTSNIRIARQYAPKNRLHAQQHTSESVGGDGKGGRVQDFFFFEESRRRLVYSDFQKSESAPSNACQQLVKHFSKWRATLFRNQILR